MIQGILDIQSNIEPSFDNFVVGKNVDLIYQIQQLKLGQMVYIWGEKGSGKTHLLKAIIHSFDGRYIDAQKEQVPNFQGEHPHLVGIDNIQSLDRESQEHLFYLINEWRESQIQSNAFCLLMTGDHSPFGLSHLREDLRNRLSWDQIWKLEHLSEHDLMNLFIERASNKGMSCSPQTVLWLFKNYASNASSMMDLLAALDNYTLSKHRQLSIPLIKEFLEHKDDA
ncbi:HdaA/DnaA family protein [Basilea psittacipulmonis]|uniref:Hda lid domain-containing protein n=1 Tax=Basilea psittacipulmonis DSM 24701 TaxID=1072685 RepID=A0A077DIJ6_9BURK|nr:DnaA/Hda family protein [Basilea psittacipulmonis]AIL32998.1 hypothetical protein IX83_06440 [Basilea psittacipulmonis DSM 24701]